MFLKVKKSELSAGRPVAILNEKTADKISIHVNDRILIKKNSKKIIAVLDLTKKMADGNEISLSTEITDYLKLKKGEKVEISITAKPRAVQLIDKKLSGKRLNKEEIYTIIKSIVSNALTEAEIAFFVSAVYKCGMSLEETAWLTEAMLKTGKKLNLKNKIIVDKHSVGGVPGNRTTPIVIPICASAGLVMPKTSSRAITSASGTADTIETIAKVEFTINEVKKIINKVGACMIWGGSLGLAPADDKIIQVERLLNLDPEPQLLASIMAKKLAVGSKYLLIDIPYGENSKVTKKQALKLKRNFEKLALYFKIKIKCVLTRGNEPIGNGIGPILEMRDIISVFRGNGPKDLKDKSIFLAAQILEMTGKTKKGQGIKMAEEILYSGKAFKKFKEIIKAQKGNPDNIYNILKLAKFSHDIRASRNCKIHSIDNRQINMLARFSGSPADKSAGIYLYKHVGERAKKGEKLLTIYAESEPELKNAIDFYRKNKIIIVK